MTSAILITLILPMALFYYETDEEKSFVSIPMLTYSLLETEAVGCYQVRNPAYYHHFTYPFYLICFPQIRKHTPCRQYMLIRSNK